jgi:hypothetical protein
MNTKLPPTPNHPHLNLAIQCSLNEAQCLRDSPQPAEISPRPFPFSCSLVPLSSTRDHRRSFLKGSPTPSQQFYDDPTCDSFCWQHIGYISRRCGLSKSAWELESPSSYTGGKGWCPDPVHHKYIARKWTKDLANTHPEYSKDIQNFPSQFN